MHNRRQACVWSYHDTLIVIDWGQTGAMALRLRTCVCLVLDIVRSDLSGTGG
jgi:hypothetical protein